MSFLTRMIFLFVLLAAGHSLAAATETPDPSFGTAGRVFDPFVAPANEDHLITRIAQRHDDRLVVGGWRTTHNAGNATRLPLLGLLDADGNPITAGSFVDGRWIHDFAPGTEEGWINRVLTLPNGEVLYCGGRTAPGGFLNGHRAVVGRLTPQLLPDASFGNSGSSGWFELSLGLGDVDCTALEQLADGSIAIGGSYIDQDLGQPADQRQHGTFLARLDRQGQLLAGFASNGVRVDLFDSPWIQQAWISALAVRPDNQLYASVNLRTTSQSHWGELRFYRADGSLDRVRSRSSGRENLGSAYLHWLPGDQMQVGSDHRLGMPTLRVYREDNSIIGPSWSHDWHGSFGGERRSGGLAMLGNGRSLAVDIETDPGDSSYVYIQGLGNDGEPAFDHPVVSAVAVPGGHVERFLPGDLLIQDNNRHLVVVNRYTSSGSTSSRIRPLLRRYLPQSDGSTWAHDLLPNHPAFGTASARPNQMATSPFHTISGLSAGIHVPIWVRDGEMQVNFGPWTTAPTLVSNNDVVRVRGFAPATVGDEHSVRLGMGGVRQSNSWNVVPQNDQLTLASFVIVADQPTLPGVRCSEVGLASNCSGSIPDNSGSLVSEIPFTYASPASCSYIQSLRVGLDISHTWVGDLRVILRDPNGQVFIGGSVGYANLLDRPHNGQGGGSGSCSGDNVLATFDAEGEFKGDDACDLMPGSAAISGVVRPSQSFIEFIGRPGTGSDGSSSTGVWQLTVRDLAGGSIGTLNDWSLDLTCSATPPALADLAVTVTPPPRLVGGASTAIPFTITNHGPAAVSTARFQALLPFGIGRELRLPTWSCSASAGSSCILPPSSCGGMFCVPPIEPTLHLAPGGQATVTISGTVDHQAPGTLPLEIDALAWIPLTIGGSTDPDDDNNAVAFSQAIELDADLSAEHVEATLVEPQRLLVRARYRNLGPSLASDMTSYVTLPDGYTVESWTCQRGDVACGGTAQTNLGGRELVLSGQSAVGALGDLSPFEVEVLATWTGSQPAGQVMLFTTLGSGSHATDPDNGNNGAASPIPTQVSSAIFSDGFE